MWPVIIVIDNKLFSFLPDFRNGYLPRTWSSTTANSTFELCGARASSQMQIKVPREISDHECFRD
jgi:hypothetical protein